MTGNSESPYEYLSRVLDIHQCPVPQLNIRFSINSFMHNGTMRTLEEQGYITNLEIHETEYTYGHTANFEITDKFLNQWYFERL